LIHTFIYLTISGLINWSIN